MKLVGSHLFGCFSGWTGSAATFLWRVFLTGVGLRLLRPRTAVGFWPFGLHRFLPKVRQNFVQVVVFFRPRNDSEVSGPSGVPLSLVGLHFLPFFCLFFRPNQVK